MSAKKNPRINEWISTYNQVNDIFTTDGKIIFCQVRNKEMFQKITINTTCKNSIR